MPGKILQRVKPRGLGQDRLAGNLGRTLRRTGEIVHTKPRITAHTTLQPARYFKGSPESWLGLQMKCGLQLKTDRLKDGVGGKVEECCRTP